MTAKPMNKADRKKWYAEVLDKTHKELARQEEILRMAREAGLWPAVTDVFPKELERFAALVLAKDFEDKRWDEMFKDAILLEREACAKVCEENGKEPDDHKTYEGYDEGYQDGSNNCAAAIRARGE